MILGGEKFAIFSLEFLITTRGFQYSLSHRVDDPPAATPHWNDLSLWKTWRDGPKVKENVSPFNFSLHSCPFVHKASLNPYMSLLSSSPFFSPASPSLFLRESKYSCWLAAKTWLNTASSPHSSRPKRSGGRPLR